MPTSITAFIGLAWKGPLDEPVAIAIYPDFERKFGGLWYKSTMSYAVHQFFLNGGKQAIIVRVAKHAGPNAAKVAYIELSGGSTLRAANEGTWGRNLIVTIDHKVEESPGDRLFNITILDDPDNKYDSEK